MIKKLLSKNSLTANGSDISLLLLRITFGGLMLMNHGISKKEKLFADGEIKFGDPIGIGVEASLTLAVFAELVCATLLILGLFTRLVTIPLIITMLVAVFIIHIGDGLEGMESALLYLIPYIIIFINGGGKYSLDNLIFKN